MEQFQQLCSLSQFGLNPKEWSIIQLKGSQFIIQNRQDIQYRFVGRYYNKKWLHLELFSL